MLGYSSRPASEESWNDSADVLPGQLSLAKRLLLTPISKVRSRLKMI